MVRILFSIAYLFFIQTHLFGQPEMQEERKALSLSAAYIGDIVSVVSGGLRQGSTYLGMVNFKFNFETEKAGLWKGGNLFLNAAATHGAKPSRDFLGDYQIASNIEAGDRIFIQELWLQHAFNSFRFIFGLQDVSTEFASCNSGGLFLNSSFGIQPTITSNIPASVFPLTSLGITFVWSSSENWKWKAALYDGAPTVFEQNPHNLSWSFQNSEGMINLFEAEYYTETEMLKLGVYHHDHLYEQSETGNKLVYEHNVGVYSIADLQLLQLSSGSSFHLFGQLGYSSREINQNFWFVSLGTRYTGVFSEPHKDELGVAIAHAGINSLKDETTIELTYRRQLYELIFIQPDIQYILNPAGTDVNLKHALVFTFRIGFNL